MYRCEIGISPVRRDCAFCQGSTENVCEDGSNLIVELFKDAEREVVRACHLSRIELRELL